MVAYCNMTYHTMSFHVIFSWYTILYHAVSHHAIQVCSVLCCAVLCCTVLYCARSPSYLHFLSNSTVSFHFISISSLLCSYTVLLWYATGACIYMTTRCYFTIMQLDLLRHVPHRFSLVTHFNDIASPDMDIKKKGTGLPPDCPPTLSLHWLIYNCGCLLQFFCIAFIPLFFHSFNFVWYMFFAILH